MKKKTNLFAIVFSLIAIICGCQSNMNESLENISSVETKYSDVKKHIDTNTYIDINVSELVKEVASPKTRSTVAVVDKVAKMKAAIYRFYSKVKLVNGIYTCNVTSASDINVSIGVYTALLNNLNEMNEVIKKAKDSGKSVNAQEVDEAYLNSLLE